MEKKMVFDLILLVFFGLLVLISFGFLIGGLIKKKQIVWISSLVASVVFILITVFLGVSYIEKSIDYMGSDSFQEMTRKNAENMGKSWGNTVSGAADGLEQTLDQEVIDKLAHKTAQIVGSGVKTIASGLDETLGKAIIYQSESLDGQGIEIGRAELTRDSSKTGYKLMLTFARAFNDTLVLTSYDSEGLKQEVSKRLITANTNESKVVTFLFDETRQGITNYCILER